MSDPTPYFIFNPPPSAGCWQIGGSPGLSIHIRKRPRWLTRFLMRHLLEWEWVDAEGAGK